MYQKVKSFFKKMAASKNLKALAIMLLCGVGQYESLKLIVKAEGYDDIICVLDPFEIERISVGDYKLTEVVVSVGGLGGFEIEGGLDFE